MLDKEQSKTLARDLLEAAVLAIFVLSLSIGAGMLIAQTSPAVYP